MILRVSTKRRQNEEARDGGNIKEVEKRNMDSGGGDENRDAKIDWLENDEDLWEPMQWRSPSKLNEGEDSKEKMPSGGDQSDEKDYNELIYAEENGTDDDQSDKDSDEENFRLSRRICVKIDRDHGGNDCNRDQYDAKGSSSKLNEGEDLKEKISSGGDQSDEKEYNKLINAEENDADDDQSDKDSDEESKSSGSTNGIQKGYGVGVVYPKINPFPSALRELVILLQLRHS
ncbi:hypothetical protein Tco_0567447 [Tanacetum coccineum]